MNMLSTMTISVFVIHLLSLMLHAYLKQLVTFYLRAVRFVPNSRDSCNLVSGLLRTCLSLIDICSRARFIGLSTRKAMSHRVRHIVGYYLFFVCASSFVTSSDFYFQVRHWPIFGILSHMRIK
jgi:predicted Na+-dependent transporter